MASPSGSSAPGGSKYDVFLSYSGEDTGNTFTSHLRDALYRKKIKAFRVDHIERGKEIQPALLKAIEGSKLSVVILSQNYASSTWCLDELDQILDCKETYQQLVIPIFYEVDPSHVRKQRESFEAAFDQHEQRFKDTPDKVLKWRNALTKVSDLAGFHSRNIRPDSELVGAVVKAIAKKLSECFNCGESGHWAKDCPLAGDQEMNGMKMGREAYSSSGQSNYGGGDRSSAGRNECFKCGRTGHWARCCPYAGDQEWHGLGQAGGEDSNNDYTGYSYGGRRSTSWEDVCFKCGGRGHWQYVCPSVNSGSDDDSN